MSRQAGSDLLGLLRGAQMVASECISLQEKQASRIWKNSTVRTAISQGSKSVSETLNSGKNLPNIQDYVNEAAQRVSMITHGLKAFVLSGQDGKKDSEFAGNDYLIYDNMVLKPDDIEKLLEESYPHIENFDIRDVSKQNDDASVLSFKAELTFGAGIPKSDGDLLHIKSSRNIEELAPAYGGGMGIDKDDGKSRPLLEKIIPMPINYIETSSSIRPEEMLESDLKTAKEFVGKVEIPTPSVEPVNNQQIPDKGKPLLKTVKFKQKLSEAARERKVPSTRLSRVISFGTLAAGLGIGTVAEVTRRTLGMNPTSIGTTLDSAFLTQANAERIVKTLCKVRGAALKIGQLLSIQDNNIISPVLQQAFERVRQSADFMPQYQIRSVLEAELGQDWEKHFADFELKPFAAASIGQVHKAELKDGRLVAVKIQYPGVAQGINSDIDNLVSVLKLWNIFPEGMFIENVVEVAKRELSWEVDYEREAECTKKFKELLAPYPDYYIPEVVDHLCTKQVFVSELIDGVPVDKASEFDEQTRKHVCKLIMDLCLKEIFVFRYMQTDPNWSNFFYNQDSKKLILLDFGSSRPYEKSFIDEYIKVIKAAADGDRKLVLEMSKKMKFLTGFESKAMEEAHVDTVMILGEIFNESTGEFDFGRQDTTARVTRLVPTILSHRLCPPPEEIYSLHRKLSGVFLLCSKLNVKMDCRPMFLQIYNSYSFD